MLRQTGVVKPDKPPVADNARSRITSEFRRYLLQECGRSPATLLNYVPVIEEFLSERFHDRTPNRAVLRAADVTGFVMRHAGQLSPVRAKLMATALRSFFRYLRHRGAIATDLAGCVPTVPNGSLSTLPRFFRRPRWNVFRNAVIERRRLAGGTMRSCCGSPGLASAPAKSWG